MLRGTRDRTISHDTALIPKTARPAKTNGLDMAVRSMVGAFVRLDISPTLVIPCFRRSCANAANITLNTIKIIFFNSALSFSLWYIHNRWHAIGNFRYIIYLLCLVGFDYKISDLLFYIHNICPYPRYLISYIL